mgnify:FL=1
MTSSTHEGRVAAVTGAGQGFGRAIAKELARRGADIVVLDLDEAPETVAEIDALGRKAIALQADVSDPDAVEAASRQALDTFGADDI